MKIALIVILIAVALSPILASADLNLLFPTELFPIGSSPVAAAIGDVNNDGRNDVVIVSWYANRPDTDYHVHVLLQNDRGQLAPPVKYPTSAGYTRPPSSIAIGDVNNDGRVDVVVGMYEGAVGEESHIDVFLQNSSGGLDPAKIYTSINSSIIKIGDMNGDGRLDIVGRRMFTGSVDVLLQNENGTLEPPVTYPSLTTNYFNDNLSVGDLNNDGLTDIVVLNGSNIGVLLQQSGSLAPPVVYPFSTTGESYGIDVGDVNGDGLQDVAVAHGSDTPEGRTVGIFRQNSLGTLDPMINYATYGRSEYVHIADMNNDGKQDLIVQYGGYDALYYFGIFLQGSDGTLLPEELYFCGNGFYPLAGDINGDGLNDLVMNFYVGLSDGAMVFYHRKYEAEINEVPNPVNFEDIPIGSATSQTIIIYNTGAADLNVKALSITGSDSSQFNTQYDNCTGQILPPLYGCAVDIVFLPTSTGAKRAALAVSSNDPDNAILITGLYGNLSYAALFRTPYATFPISKGWATAVAIGDVNDDGRNDVVLGASGYDSSFHVFLQTESGGLNPPVMYLTGGNATSVDIGDVNNDGKNDIVVGNGNSIMVYLQHSSEGFEPPMIYMLDTNQLKMGDFNGDGLLDVASIPWGSQPDGSHTYVDVLFQNQNGVLDPPVQYYIPHGGYDEIVASDVNNDGLTDIVVMSGQAWYPNVNVLLQQPDGSLGNPIYYDLGTYELTRGLAVGDINGDEMKDLVVTNGESPPDARIAGFSPGSGGYLPSISLNSDYYNAPPDKVAIADVNLDGKNDIIVLHGIAGLGVFLQDTSGMFRPEEIYDTAGATWYQSGALAVGDINGDGLADVLIANDPYGLVVHYHTPQADLPLKLLSPNGGEHIATGSVYTVQWTAPATAKKYMLKYSPDNGVTWNLLEKNIAGTTYNWHILLQEKNKQKCLVRVIGYDESHRIVGADRSDSPFTIEVVKVTAPDGAAVWTSGENRAITWITNETIGPVEKVKLFYTKDSGVTWLPITTITGSNPGTFSWRVPDVLKNKKNCKVKVLLKDAMGNTVGKDASDRVFTIQPAPL